MGGVRPKGEKNGRERKREETEIMFSNARIHFLSLLRFQTMVKTG